MIEIKDKAHLDELKKDDKLLVVKLGAEWCGPCRTLSPLLKELSNENENCNIADVNVDTNADISTEYGVRSIPVVLFIKDSEIVEKRIGLVNKIDLQTMIDSHI